MIHMRPEGLALIDRHVKTTTVTEGVTVIIPIVTEVVLEATRLMFIAVQTGDIRLGAGSGTLMVLKMTKNQKIITYESHVLTL